ncbi:hypothetical protein PR048_010316 [Dryococelus australis]|uniref:Uncharacterized protein n=1 Tax=Dryococelus australis TaxID=614101 RepID=A0ABQ9I2C9_9NEOP|nr:hypothetical protein PR048_010316 [Dryococelus australis]
MLLLGNEHPLPSGTCVQDISAKKPHLTSQLLMKYMENNTGEENAMSDNVNREHAEVEDIEDEPEGEKTQLAESLSGSDEEEALRS